MRWIPNAFLARPEDALAFAWSAPLRELAARLGLSDVALRKLLHAQGIVTPPQGHWNRVHAGREPPAPPAPPPRRPGETGRVRLDPRLRGHVAAADPLPENGPFASPKVPESLVDLRAQELAALGRVSAPRDLSRAPAGLAKLLRKEDARRAKAAVSDWHWDAPHFDTPLGQRQLRLLAGLFGALARRGHEGEAWDENGDLRVHVTIGDTLLWPEFAIVDKHRTEMRGGQLRAARDLPARTPLRLALKRELRGNVATAWQDMPDLPLERQLAAIAADLITAGEAAFRQGLVEAREEAERRRQREAEHQRARLEARNRERLGHLERSGELLRQAEDLRALVERVSAAVTRGGLALGADELAAWQTWALARADELDPVHSGQVFAHLRPPDSD